MRKLNLQLLIATCLFTSLSWAQAQPNSTGYLREKAVSAQAGPAPLTATLKIEYPPDAIDGADSGVFRAVVTPNTVVPTSYRWRWKLAPVTPGNSPEPSVTFSSPAGSETIIQDARWYPAPDHPINCGQYARYYIYVDAMIDGQVVSAKRLWSVYIPMPGGETYWPLIKGLPEISEFVEGGVSKWRVSGVGGMRRQSPIKKVHVPERSRFFTKIDLHENRHLDQMNGLVAGISTGEIWKVSDCFAKLQHLEDAVNGNLLVKALMEIRNYNAAENIKGDALREQMEADAHAISDIIPPPYFLNNHGLGAAPEGQ